MAVRFFPRHTDQEFREIITIKVRKLRRQLIGNMGNISRMHRSDIKTFDSCLAFLWIFMFFEVCFDENVLEKLGWNLTVTCFGEIVAMMVIVSLMYVSVLKHF